jgi:hypothetical protein
MNHDKYNDWLGSVALFMVLCAVPILVSTFMRNNMGGRISLGLGLIIVGVLMASYNAVGYKGPKPYASFAAIIIGVIMLFLLCL